MMEIKLSTWMASREKKNQYLVELAMEESYAIVKQKFMFGTLTSPFKMIIDSRTNSIHFEVLSNRLCNIFQSSFSKCLNI